MSDLRKLEQVIKRVRGIDGALPTQHLHFLLIVDREDPNGGASFIEMAKDLGCDRSTVSRIGRYLGTYMKRNKTGNMVDVGKGWVEVKPDPYQPKSFVAILTKKGRKLCEELAIILAK